MRTIHDVMQRIRAEYLEMPGLRLSADQVRRLCGIEEQQCQLVLDALVAAKFLCVKSDGHYARSTDGQWVSPKLAKADLRAEGRSAKAS